MALTFPTYFPQAFLGPVVKAAANAEREFRADVKAVPLAAASAKRAATKYITMVALVFAHQACEAARAEDPHVAVSRIAWYIEDFLRRLSAHVYHELTDPDLRHRWGSWQAFEREMQSAVMESPRWQDHLAERAAVADDASDVSSRKTDVQVPSAVGPMTENDGVRSVRAGPVLPLPSNASPEQKRQAVKAYLDEVSIFRHTSDGLWEVAFEGQKRVGLKNLKGMELIRRLLANSGLQIAAFQLVAGSGAAIESGAVPDEDQIDDALNEGVFATAAPWTGMPTLDAQAKREVKAQLIALREKRQSAQERGDQVEEARIDDEVSAIEDRLRLDFGLHGRPRRMGSDAEKARHTASRRYRTALDYLREQLPALAEHLKRCIRPGAKFVYQPPTDVITWLT